MVLQVLEDTDLKLLKLLRDRRKAYLVVAVWDRVKQGKIKLVDLIQRYYDLCKNKKQHSTREKLLEIPFDRLKLQLELNDPNDPNNLRLGLFSLVISPSFLFFFFSIFRLLCRRRYNLIGR